ncbi:MAG: methylenetetrahydrofolate reductase [Desulfobacteraceae bacterium]
MGSTQKIGSEDFVVLAEIDPPKGVDVSKMLEQAGRIKGMVDAIVVPELSTAVMRMSSLGACMILEREGLEVIMQVSCRDRNRLALQADLLSAYACGIQNLMLVIGETPRIGDHIETKPVFDVDIYELLQTIGTLERGRDMAGIELTGRPTYFVGTQINTGLDDQSVDAEIERAIQMNADGAAYFVTTPVFDLEALKRFSDRIAHLKVPIIPTVLLLKSAGMARYMDRNLAHIHVPEDLIQRLHKAPDKALESVQIAAELIHAIQARGFRGALISTMGWEDKLPDIINAKEAL